MAKKGDPKLKYDEKFIDQAYVACQEGFTDKKLARLLGIVESTLNLWKKEYPEFGAAIRRGKDEFNVAVAEQSLMKRVKGYSYTEITKEPDKDGDLVITKTVRKNVAPDPTSTIFFLKNRAKDRWRDSQHIEHSGEINQLTDEQLDDKIAHLMGKTGIIEALGGAGEETETK